MLIVGVFWGAMSGMLTQWFSGHGFSGWVFIFGLIVGIWGSVLAPTGPPHARRFKQE